MTSPTAEAQRLRTLRGYAVLDTPPEPRFDDLAQAAASACSTPVALLSLVDRDRQFFKARIGLDTVTTPRPGSFCSHAIRGASIFEVTDAANDERFRAHPMVTGEPHVRFYAGAPLFSPAGDALGTLCVIDRKPRRLEERQRQALDALGRQAMVGLEERRAGLARAKVREALNADLRTRLERIEGALGAIRAPPKALLDLLLDCEGALQLVDDAVELLSDPGPAPRTAADLAVVCHELVTAFQGAEDGALLLSAHGDCNGAWDLDRLTSALSAFLELAGGGPVRVSVAGGGEAVTVTISAPELPLRDGGLRVEAALQIVRDHGGEVQVARGPDGGVALSIDLPRESGARAGP